MKKAIVVSIAILIMLLAAGFKEKYTHTFLDIPYAGLSPAQKLDIYIPGEGDGPFPVIISIHGGSYSGGDKMGTEIVSTKEGLNRGYAVVAINYRLSGEAIHPAQIYDVKAAIRFIKAHAREYHLDPDRIALWGSSAGGGLAALAGTSAGVKDLQDLSLGNAGQSDNVQAVVDWCGTINYATYDRQFEESGVDGELQNNPDSFLSQLMGRNIAEIPDQVQKANPENYITPDDPPFYIQHGTLDTLVPVQQSVEFSEKLKAVLGESKVVYVEMPGEGHCSPNFTSSASISRVMDFLDQNLK